MLNLEIIQYSASITNSH